MTKGKLRLLVLMTGAGLLAAGCIHRAVVREQVVITPSNPVVVAQEPPPPRVEVLSPSPGPAYVWQPGFWSFSDGRWIWVPGRWVLRPNASTVWVRGHWDRDDHRWMWTPGHWE